MRALYLGDVVGRAARQAVCARMQYFRAELKVDVMLVNGENAAGGFGLTEEICRDLSEAGADVILTGNHVWDQRELIGAIDNLPNVLRPANFPAGTPGRGAALFDLPGDRRVMVAQVMGRTFMDAMDDPFAAMDRILDGLVLGRDVDMVIVDIHAEATSEKMAMGHYLDGRVSAVFGTHTHIPSADAHILVNGTAYQTDLGMCGDYDSVIGMNKEEPIRRFTTKISGGRFTPAMGEVTLCGVLVETDDATGLAINVAPVRDGGRLRPAMPDF